MQKHTNASVQVLYHNDSHMAKVLLPLLLQAVGGCINSVCGCIVPLQNVEMTNVSAHGHLSKYIARGYVSFKYLLALCFSKLDIFF